MEKTEKELQYDIKVLKDTVKDLEEAVEFNKMIYKDEEKKATIYWKKLNKVESILDTNMNSDLKVELLEKII